MNLQVCLVSCAGSLFDHILVDLVRLRAKDVLTQISTFLSFVLNIHVARHVDIDGIRQEAGVAPDDLYSNAVDRARTLVRTLETAAQSLYDDASSLLLSTQSMRESELGQSKQDRTLAYDVVDIVSTSLKANLAVVQQSLEGLLAVGHEQADLAQGDYNGSIEWRMSRMSVIDTQFGGAIRPVSSYLGTLDDPQGEDLIDMEVAFTSPTVPRRPGDRYDTAPFQTVQNGQHVKQPSQVSMRSVQSAADDTMIGEDVDDLDDGLLRPSLRPQP